MAEAMMTSRALPSDHQDCFGSRSISSWARVIIGSFFILSEWKVFTKILFPSVLPYMLTGIRLSIGTAWLVIVAAEMLTGGVGIGFWVWDEWNNLKVESIIIAIFVIGIVGLMLEQALILIAQRFTYETR